MNVGLPEVKQDFASIVERITLQPWTMLQFIIWLDLKLAEYKVNGYMVLDQSLSSIPEWLASLNVDQPEEDNSPSESVPLQEQYMQPTNASLRGPTARSNVVRRDAKTQERRGAGFQRRASPITIDDEEVTVPEHNPALRQGNVMNPDRPRMKRAPMQLPPNAPRHFTEIKHRKVTDTSSPIAPARSPSSANIPRRDFGRDNSNNIEKTPSSEGVVSRTVNRPSPSAAQSPTQPVQSEQQSQSDIGTVSCSDTNLQDPSLSFDIKPIVSETLDDIIFPESTSRIQADAAPLVDINNFEMQEFLPAQSIDNELFNCTSSEPVPTQLFVNTVEARKTATATSTSATGSSSSSKQPNPVAGTSYETRYQVDTDFDESGDAQVKMEPPEPEPDDTEVDCASDRIAENEKVTHDTWLQAHDHSDLQCKMCGSVLKSKGTLRVHMRCHMKKFNFSCHSCDKTFLNNQGLIQHVNRVHRNTGTCKCKVCGKVFNSFRGMRDHVKQHSEEDFKCDMCSKVFCPKAKLKRHSASHNRPFFCGYEKCTKAFSSKGELKSHMLKHNPSSTKFACAICNYKSIWKSAIQRHEREVHSRHRPCVCERCGFAFKTSASLKRHTKKGSCKPSQSLSRMYKVL